MVTSGIPQTNPVNVLRRRITDEIFNALGLNRTGIVRFVLNPLFYLPAQRFTALAIAFDRDVADFGFREAVRRVLPKFVEDYTVTGVDRVPTEGSLIIASNHPGAVDSLVIAASLPRDDLKIIISGIPFLRGLSAAKAHFIYASADLQDRMTAVRESIRHLREGGSLLVYPSGRLDPDPAFMAGAENELERWSKSLALFSRKVSETWIVPTIASGVLDPRFIDHPFTRFQQGRFERQRLAEFLQIIQQMVFRRFYPLVPRVTFGAPLDFGGMDIQSRSTNLMDQIIANARLVLMEHQATHQSAPKVADEYLPKDQVN